MRHGIPLIALLLLPACSDDQVTTPLEARFSRDVATPRALASGSVLLRDVQGPVSFIAIENYDFNAVRSGPGLEAHGHIAWNITIGDGGESYGRADVGCAAVVGNTAWISGPVTHLVNRGETVVPGPDQRWALLRVTDGGEGKGAVDVGSILVFSPVNYMQMFCTVRPPAPPAPGGILPEAPISRGNITVHSD